MEGRCREQQREPKRWGTPERRVYTIALALHVESANDGQTVHKAAATHTRERSTSGTFALLRAGESSSTSSGVSFQVRGDGHPAALIGEGPRMRSQRLCCGCLPAAGRPLEAIRGQHLPVRTAHGQRHGIVACCAKCWMRSTQAYQKERWPWPDQPWSCSSLPVVCVKVRSPAVACHPLPDLASSDQICNPREGAALDCCPAAVWPLSGHCLELLPTASGDSDTVDSGGSERCPLGMTCLMKSLLEP